MSEVDTVDSEVDTIPEALEHLRNQLMLVRPYDQVGHHAFGDLI